MSTTVIDFETRSPVILKNCGVFPYAEHTDTEVLCLAAAIDGGAPVLWVPECFKDNLDCQNVEYPLVDAELIIDITMSSNKIVAHNSMFEYMVWNKIMHEKFGWPELPLDRLHDSMAALAYHALPLKLEKAGEVMGLPMQKDTAGHKIMMKMCKPRKPRKAEKEKIFSEGCEEIDDKTFYHPESDSTFYFWHEDQKSMEKLLNYCGRDVEAEWCIHKTLPPLPDMERKIWLMDQRINLRGIGIDVDTVSWIVDAIGGKETAALNRFKELTEGKVSTPRSYVALKNWVNEEAGLSLKTVNKEKTLELLGEGGLPDHVTEALEIKASLSRSSVAKFRSMQNRLDSSNRIKGLAQYHGAATGRWAARGVQTQNLPRDSYATNEYEALAKWFKSGGVEGIEAVWGDVYQVASRMIRGSLTAGAGNRLICSDFSSIEGRMLPHLAGENWVVNAYRDGMDMYKVSAAIIFGVEYETVNKGQRQVGKVSELALGYQGGIGAYASMASAYRIDLETFPALILPSASDGELKAARRTAKSYLKEREGGMSLEAAMSCDIIKQKWRGARPRVTQFWADLESAAVSAVKHPGTGFNASQIAYVVDGRFLKCELPSGRKLHYYLPELSKKKVFGQDKDVLSYEGMKMGETGGKQWFRINTYGGKLCENVVQAACRDLLAEAMLRLEAAGYKICLHVHDEAVADMPEGQGSLEEFNKIMEIVPSWAEGMPITSDGWVGKRYRK